MHYVSINVWVPQRASLVEGPVNLSGGAPGEWAGGGGVGAGVFEEGSVGEDLGGEAGGCDNIVVPRGLVSGDEDGHALPEVDVEGRVADLERVRSFNLDHLHLVALDAEIEGVLKSHIAYPKAVRLALVHGEDRGPRAAAVDQNTVGERQSPPIVQKSPQNLHNIEIFYLTTNYPTTLYCGVV